MLERLSIPIYQIVSRQTGYNGNHPYSHYKQSIFHYIDFQFQKIRLTSKTYQKADLLLFDSRSRNFEDCL